MNFTLRVNGENVKLGLETLGRSIPNITIEESQQAMEDAQKQASAYLGGNLYSVPERPGQKYQRTGNYGRSFLVTRRGLSFQLSAKAYHRGKEYTYFVGGDRQGEGQAWMHVGRWPIIADVVSMKVQKLVERLDQRLHEEILADGFEGRMYA